MINTLILGDKQLSIIDEMSEFMLFCYNTCPFFIQIYKWEKQY